MAWLHSCEFVTLFHNRKIQLIPMLYGTNLVSLTRVQRTLALFGIRPPFLFAVVHWDRNSSPLYDKGGDIRDCRLRSVGAPFPDTGLALMYGGCRGLPTFTRFGCGRPFSRTHVC